MAKKTTTTADTARAKAGGDGAQRTAVEKLGTAREKFSKVAAGVEQKVQQVRAGAGKATEQIKVGAGKAGEAAKESYGQARESVKQGYDRVSKDMTQLSEDLSEYVRHNPGKSMAIAVGVGFVLGLLMRGGRRE